MNGSSLPIKVTENQGTFIRSFSKMSTGRAKTYIRISFLCAFTLVCTITTCTLSAQLTLTQFTRYSTQDGLNHNHITAITQDSIGYIWIGSEAGPMRFDGTSFVALSTLNPDYAREEPFTVKLTTLSKNEIGISTLYGAHVLDNHQYGFRTLHFDVDENLSTWAYNTYDVSQDDFGFYGVSTKTGFYIFDQKGEIAVKKQVFEARDIGTAWMLYGRELVRMPDGRMLQKNAEGFSVFDPGNKRILDNPQLCHLDTALMAEDVEIHLTFIDSSALIYYGPLTKNIYLHNLQSGEVRIYPIPQEMTNNLNWFSRIIVRNDSTLLINGKNGIYQIKYNPHEKYIQLDPRLQLPDMEIASMYCDREHRLWIGTYRGLYKENISMPVHQFPFSFPGKEGLVHVRWLEKDGNVWYASALQDGLITMDAKDFHVLDQKIIKENNEAVRLGKMLRYDANHLWICCTNGMMEYNLRSRSLTPLKLKNCAECLKGIVIHDVYRDRQGNIWLAGNEGNKVYKINPSLEIESIAYSVINSKFKVNNVYRFNEDGHGNIWFCGDAMARYNPSLHKVDSLIERLPLQSSPRKVFLAFHNSKNELWISTNGENWHIYDDQHGFTILDNMQLSPDLNKYQSMIDDVLYFISRQGKIVALNTLTRQARILSAIDGWDQETMSSFGFFKDPSTGDILFAGDNMMYSFKSVIPISTINHQPFISEIKIADAHLIHQPAGHLVFGPHEHPIQIKFQTLNFNDPANQSFSYRLKENENSTWINTDQPEITLTQVPYGQYTLELRVMARNNDWPPAFSAYPITIRYPFYLKWWFIGLALCGLGFAVWLVIRSRLRQMKFISNLDKQVIEYELKALHAQMNPHFVFNCLNSIKEMIMSKDNKHANIYLNKFSYLLRATLEQSKLAFVPLSHTIEYLQNYLEMEKLRFTSFRYQIEVAEGMETESIMVAPLLLQPIVENAIWHGQPEDKNGEQLHMRFYTGEDKVICEVEDFGIGMKASKKKDAGDVHLSSALENIRKRIELLNKKYDVAYQLRIIDKMDSKTGQGTIVRLSFKQKLYEFD